MTTKSPLEIRHLYTLLTLARTGSFTETGRLLHLTQSAISYQIKALEEHYRVKIFERKTLPPRFTMAGQSLLELARVVQDQVSSTEHDLERIARAEAGQLRITVSCHSSFDWLLPANERFHERYPGVLLDFVMGWPTDPVTMLKQGIADVIIAEEVDEPAVVQQPMFSFEVMAVLPKGHALLAKPFLTAADFANDTLITYPLPDNRLDVVHKVLQPAGITPPRRTNEFTAAIVQLVALGHGLATLPAFGVADYAKRGYVEVRPITEHGLYCDLFAIIRPESARIGYVAAYLDEIRTAGTRHVAQIWQPAGAA
ncbi:LysR family transcriptional regulator [Leeia oryzae]|uniref:LysR family transcriptional regulator n=1 Tax=Leeia oryzae TaxID=356662 RepID=UPI0003715688|nr:LysR family transcriptional regulator [Leeia oryzae]